MQGTQHLSHDPAPPANGQSTIQELFALTDEQILEIEPQAEVASGAWRVASQETPRNTGQPPATGEETARVAPASLPAGSAANQEQDKGRLEAGATQAQPSAKHDAQPGVAVPPEPPAWLAAQMKDPWSGEEAKELWDGVQQARQEAAAYRAAFATPEDARALKELYPGGVSEARAASERAKILDTIDRAYFAGDPAQRSQLAAMMLREDPAAFREMVFAGLRALEDSSPVGATLSSRAQSRDGSPGSDAAGTSAGGASPAPTATSVVGAQHAASQPGTASANEAHVAAYAAFEKAANEDLERSIGGAIARTLEQALPNVGGSAQDASSRAQHGPASLTTSVPPLQARLSAAIRQDVEASLKGDRQLGGQIAQILSSRRFDGETRSQVVRLIEERARQLVPASAKRVLSDWTQATLAAHRAQTARVDAASVRREVAPASAALPDGLPVGKTSEIPRSARNDNRAARPARIDYRKLSDEQILDS